MSSTDYRNSFLRWLYNNRVFLEPGVHYSEIANIIGVDPNLIKNDLGQLEYQNLIEVGALGGSYYLTIYGIQFVENQNSSNPEIMSIRSNRREFLRRLKAVKDSSGGGYIDRNVVGGQLNLTEEDTHFVVFYLRSLELIETILGPSIRISEKGYNYIVEDIPLP